MHHRAIHDLPSPQNLKQLQSVLGKINSYRRFIPHASSISAPLHRLRHKGVPFIWTTECEHAFHQLKSMLLSNTCLTPFDPQKPLLLKVDASDFGIGAVLAHRDGSHDRPITDLPIHIEKEALALVFGVTKFHDFLYGRHFTIITDHKPLTSLFHPTKPVPARTAQKFIRWSIFLSQYCYDILYQSTAKHRNADALSRLPVAEYRAFDSSELACVLFDAETVDVFELFPIDFRCVAIATAADPVLATVLRFVATQWPLSKSRIGDLFVRRFFAHKERLFVRCGVLLLRSDNDQSRVVVPRSLQSSVLQLLHKGHWGIVRTKQLARQHCTWFGIDAAITNMCSSCMVCAEQQSAPSRKFFAWPKATSPWQRLHIDFAGPFWNARWLVVVDSFSNFSFVVWMSSTTSSTTIQALSAIFCIEGLPQTLVSDNGPQFMSAEFQSFFKANGIQHLTSAQFSSQSNGAAERLVRTFKSQMLKLKDSHSREDALFLFLSSYRSQPLDGRSPAELLHGRPHRTLMSLLHPPHQVPVQRQKPAFAPGDVVYYRHY
ncbi:uncharacterized protein K02A2.6-like [Schistocerca gregaria]|uniref:uncharacterized protein K02A2.6-like n=1 Tax=Schistocerca gregaria TaxID=7010 RepID=UPI00211EBD4D|nr:uncharacterized protein K02A2.6-like [Schistocerca gregaria]